MRRKAICGVARAFATHSHEGATKYPLLGVEWKPADARLATAAAVSAIVAAQDRVRGAQMISIGRRQLMTGMAALAAPGLAFRAGAATASAYPKLQALLDSYVAAKKLPGAVVSVQRRGLPVDYVAAGALAFDTEAKAAPDSLYRVYSMTKPTVGVAAMILIEEGRLRLDQPLSDILPEFRDMTVIVGGDVTKTRPAASPILIRNLLTHTSGLSYNINGDSPLARLYRQQGIKPASRVTAPGPGERPPVRNLEEFGARLSKLPLDFDPGTKWQYSVAADLMGLVIQRVSGMSFWDFLHTRIFEPLRMPDTDFMVPANKLDRLTTVYTKTPTGLVDSDDRKSSPFARDRDLPSGGGGLVSTAHDYARFNAMLLNEGELDGVRILKPETVRIARSNLMPPGPVFGLLGRPNGFGAFMQVVLPGGELPGGEPAGSFGWSGAAGTTMWIDPVNAVAVVLMVQFMPAGAYPIYLESRVAAYQDLRALRALKAN
jgi:CubicO group peptidase (beta-lactamase class C family)